MNPVNDPTKRHDFLLLFDCENGNPNGDPDAGNSPRVDPETMRGIVTDVGLKRKVRDYVAFLKEGDDGYEIYVQHKGILQAQQEKAYDANKIKSYGKPKDRETQDKLTEWMCKTFYDIRMFGALMTNKEANCGQVKGPLQMTFAQSVDPVSPTDLTLTRVAVSTRKEAEGVEKKEGQEAKAGKETMMGKKAYIPYGLYVEKGFFVPQFATKTGVTEEDVELFWNALQMMFEMDRSSSRGVMTCRGLYVFTHDNPYGNAPAQRLFELVSIKCKDGVLTPRSFGDYDVVVNEESLPDGVVLTKYEM